MIIDDPERRCAGLVAIGIDRKNQSGGIDGCVLFRENKTAAERVFVVEFVARIEFGAVREDVAINARSNAIEDQIADVVGTKKDGTITIENRSLEIEIARLLLIGQNFVSVIFRLVLIQFRRVECSSSHVVEHWRLPWAVGDLKIIVVVADDEREPARIVDKVREVAEFLELIRVVVNWAAAAGGVFDSYAVVQITG